VLALDVDGADADMTRRIYHNHPRTASWCSAEFCKTRQFTGIFSQ